MRVWGDDGHFDIDVRALDLLEWSKLVDAHSAAQDKPGPWNEETFPPALIEACTGLKGAVEWWDEAPAKDAEALFEECLRRSAPKSFEWAIWRLRKDPRTLAEVECATDMGISYTEFSRWDVRDRDLAMAAMVIRADVCVCGVPKDRREDPTYTGRALRRPCVHCQKRENAAKDVPAEDRGTVHIELEVGGP